MSEYTDTLKQSIQNYTLPILEEIMAGDYEPEIIPSIIKARLSAAYSNDQRIAEVINIEIIEGDESYSVSTEIRAVNSTEIIEV